MGLNGKIAPMKMPGDCRIYIISDAFNIFRRIGDHKPVTMLNEILKLAQGVTFVFFYRPPAPPIPPASL